MTFRISDVGHEAKLVELGERLSEKLSRKQPRGEMLDLDEDYIDAAKTILATLSNQVAPIRSSILALTSEQIEVFLEFDPEFIDAAKNILRDFIEKTEGKSRRGKPSTV
jgi:hypothetical protein